MKKFTAAMLAGAALSMTLVSVAQAKDKVIGVSWSNFQEERWKTDEAAIKKALEANGDKYISADAQSSAAKQLTDVESLISQGANALIILAQDASAIGPAVQKALEKADFKSVRGDFKFGPNHYPTQNYYMQEVVKQGDTYTQKTTATAEKNVPNPHASKCSMK